MEEQLLQLLIETQSSADGPRKQAEKQLQTLHTIPAFPLTLATIAAHRSLSLEIRQSALLTLKAFILAAWSPQFEEFDGQVLVADEAKSHVRAALLDLATSDTTERKIQNAASYVVSKIASSDFPGDWPELLPHLLHLIPEARDASLHGALKVLAELVEDGLNEEQFFQVAKDLVNVLFVVAGNEAQKKELRALAVSVFRGCFDTLEMVMEDHKAAVKAFAEEVLNMWMPLFLSILELKLPKVLPGSVNVYNGVTHGTEMCRGLVALKLQAVKALMRVRMAFPSTLAPQSPQLFSATWEELTEMQQTYLVSYVENGQQEGRMEDADGLPYTLDFLVLEDLDFLQACMRASPVKKRLEQQLQTQTGTNGSMSSNWVTDVIMLAASYAQITTEEEDLWSFDVNVFLSEETSVTANYTARTACGDLIVKLGEWLNQSLIEGLLSYIKNIRLSKRTWRAEESALYILNQVLNDWQDINREIGSYLANECLSPVRSAMERQEEFLRARGVLVAASLVKSSGEALNQQAESLMLTTIRLIVEDQSEVVKISCIRALQQYLQSLPKTLTLPAQTSIIATLNQWINTKDISDIEDSGDLMITLVETLRGALLLDTRACIAGDGLNLLFNVASRGTVNFQLNTLVTETFEEICVSLVVLGVEAYTQLCVKVLPSLIGAFDVGNITEENTLTNLAAELLSHLLKHSPTTLPSNFVSTVFPRLNRLLLHSTDDELLKSCTASVKYILQHDAEQLFSFNDPETHKQGLELVLVIIDRLLGPSVDDNSAAEVGGLAAEIVEKAGAERLGPYLVPLLQAVAVRLMSATQAQLIQSLILVFARLSLRSPQEVVDFLAQVQIGGAQNERYSSGLHSVMSKWLENSAHFAGYEEIRQNVTALTKLYQLHDARLAGVPVKGDLVVPRSDRIMTRSKAKEKPDQWTMVGVQVKIIKVLVEELGNTVGMNGQISGLQSAAANGAGDLLKDGSDEEDEDDEDWEDEDNVLDLGLGTTKAELMAFAEETPGGGRTMDDETQAFLTAFFRAAANEEGFQQIYSALNEQEQEKLRMLL